MESQRLNDRLKNETGPAAVRIPALKRFKRNHKGDQKKNPIHGSKHLRILHNDC